MKFNSPMQIAILGCLLMLVGCADVEDVKPATTLAKTAKSSLSAQQFILQAETELQALGSEAEYALWAAANHISHATQFLSAKANERYTAATIRWATQASAFELNKMDALTARKFALLKTSLPAPAPDDPSKTAQLSRLASQMKANYGQAKYCPKGKAREKGKLGEKCLSEGDMADIMANSNDPNQLLAVWKGWRQLAPPMRQKYQRFVQISNEGAIGLGFADLGAMWRSAYDMQPDDFAQELKRLWSQVSPLYEALHCHVRARLGDYYGTDVVAPDGPIPAHLLGNMWAQSWGNIYAKVAPANADPGFDLTEKILEHQLTEVDMVKQGEAFFSSLGFEPLPETFWQRSLFVKPRDRDVVCHASAWNPDGKDDLRIKMCIRKNAGDFRTIHHELGHNYYQRAYNTQPYLFQNSANDGFHEAIGDTIALSVTPGYLKHIGLLDNIPDASKDIGLLMKMALDKIAFLPFGLLVDLWRWKVFSGEITAKHYNQGWWDLRRQYQGILPPEPRSEAFFDAGAKYHVPANTPYSRYFIAHILQFQFHRSLCDIAQNQGPLHRCSIFANIKAGEKLNEMLTMGASRPWPEALSVITGQDKMDASAVLDYFAPLKIWLDKQNNNRQCGFD